MEKTPEPRLHDSCGEIVTFDDPEEPCFWCPGCQDTVHTEDTHFPGQLVSPDNDTPEDN